MEFPNPLLEPVEEVKGELYIPGNRALINLNLTGKALTLHCETKILAGGESGNEVDVDYITSYLYFSIH